jgi:hypothetical protein
MSENEEKPSMPFLAQARVILSDNSFSREHAKKLEELQDAATGLEAELIEELWLQAYSLDAESTLEYLSEEG